MGTCGVDDRGAALGFHALDAAAAAVEVAHERAGEFVGRLDFDLHNGLEQAGLAQLHRIFEGEAARGFEGELVGVDVVVGAVKDGDLEVDDGVAGEDSRARRFRRFPFQWRE